VATAGALSLLAFVGALYNELSGRRTFSTPADIALYYLAPAGVGSLFLGSLWLDDHSRMRLLITGAAFTMAVYGAELFLVLSGASETRLFAALDTQMQLRPVMMRLADSPEKRVFAARLTKQFGDEIDVRTAYEAIDDIRKDGIDAVPIVTASNQLMIRQPDGSRTSAVKIRGHETIPLGSVSNRVTLLCNESGQWVSYRSDSRGFNNPDDLSQLGRLDVAALGDSFTQGYCVDRDKTFVDIIRQHYARTLNLGMAGDGPLFMLATLKEYVARFTPKTVLWFYYEGNDLTDLQTERQSGLLAQYLKSEFVQGDLGRQDEIDRAILAEMPRLAAIDHENAQRRRSGTFIPSLLTFLKLTSLRDRLAPIAETDPATRQVFADFEGRNLETFRQVLAQAHDLVAEWNGTLYFVYLPEWSRYAGYRSWGGDKRSQVLKLVQGLGIRVIDIEPAFWAHGDRLSLFPFRSVGHYNEAGHRLVAEEVLRQLGSTASQN
jgi:hypothetical protein